MPPPNSLYRLQAPPLPPLLPSLLLHLLSPQLHSAPHLPFPPPPPPFPLLLLILVRPPATPQAKRRRLNQTPPRPGPTNPLPVNRLMLRRRRPKIYVLGSSLNNVPSPHVWILDCRFHMWEPGPKMRIPREFAAAWVVDARIYVMGGCSVDSWAQATHWAEVLDYGEWRAVPSPAEVRDKWMHASAIVGD